MLGENMIEMDNLCCDQPTVSTIQFTQDSLVFGWILENPVGDGRDIMLP
jgi:hypothetical protein